MKIRTKIKRRGKGEEKKRRGLRRRGRRGG
jgi:hypothetical protein